MKTDDGVLNFGTKLSSAGLVYKHYGREVLGKLAAALSPPTQEFTPLEPDQEDILFRKMYLHFVEHIDGIDNGVEMAEGPFNYSITRSPSDPNPDDPNPNRRALPFISHLSTHCITSSWNA